MQSLVNAFLLCRDELVSRLDARQRRLVLGVLRGTSQKELAASEGISPSAVSQSSAARRRVRDHRCHRAARRGCRATGGKKEHSAMILLALLLATLGTADLVRPENRASVAEPGVSPPSLRVRRSSCCWRPGWRSVRAPGSSSPPSSRCWSAGCCSRRSASSRPTGRGPSPASSPRRWWPSQFHSRRSVDGWLVRWYAGLDLPTLADVSGRAVRARCRLRGLPRRDRQHRRPAHADRHRAERAWPLRTPCRADASSGPIERVFVLAHGAGRPVRGAQRGGRGQGHPALPGDLQDTAGGTRAEYVLVGSFVSLAQAFVFVPLF